MSTIPRLVILLSIYSLSLFFLFFAEIPCLAAMDMNKVASELEERRRSLHSDEILNEINAGVAAAKARNTNPSSSKKSSPIDTESGSGKGTEDTEKTHKLEVGGESVGLSDLGMCYVICALHYATWCPLTQTPTPLIPHNPTHNTQHTTHNTQHTRPHHHQSRRKCPTHHQLGGVICS